MERGVGRLVLMPELLCGTLALACFVALAAADGGAREVSWYPVAVFFTGLAGVSGIALVRRGNLRLSLLTRLAVAFLAAFCVWSFASIAWADAQGAALVGANRTILYLAVFSLFAMLPWRPRSAATILGAYAVAIAVAASLVLADTAASAQPELTLIDGRYSELIGYHNGLVALLLSAALPAAYLASLRRVPWLARGLLLAAAGVLVEIAVIPQSRGSLFALPLALILYTALAKDRVRALLALLPVLAATALALPDLLGVYEAFQERTDLGNAFSAAFSAVMLSALALFAIGAGVGFADRRLTVAAGPARVARRIAGAALALGILAAVALAIAAVGNPVSWAEDRWQEFKAGGTTQSRAVASRFEEGLGSARYDFWRVALKSFSEDPLIGVGAENFASEYVRERRSEQEPLHPHSLELRLLSQTGVVGAVLFAAFLACAAGAGLKARAARPGLGGGVASAALVAFGYWLIHGSVDWFMELPALAAPAFAWLGMAAGLSSAPRDPDPEAATVTPARRSARTAGMSTAFALGLGAVALALIPAWGAARDVELAAQSWGANPSGAYERLDRALDLNPLDERSAVVAGAIASRLGDTERMRHYFQEAVERTPSSWYAQLELGAVAAVEGDAAAAMKALRAAAALNPGEPIIREVLASAKEGRPFPLARIDAAFLTRICQRFGRTEATLACEGKQPAQPLAR